jgi:hypothetical protein
MPWQVKWRNGKTEYPVICFDNAIRIVEDKFPHFFVRDYLMRQHNLTTYRVLKREGDSRSEWVALIKEVVL